MEKERRKLGSNGAKFSETSRQNLQHCKVKTLLHRGWSSVHIFSVRSRASVLDTEAQSVNILFEELTRLMSSPTENVDQKVSNAILHGKSESGT